MQCVFRDFARNKLVNTLFREHFVQLLVSRMIELCLVCFAHAVGGFKAVIVLGKRD